MKLEIITNSRLKTFHSCQRLHHYEYDLGYRPVADRASAAYGDLMHAGLEAWWRWHERNGPHVVMDEAETSIDFAMSAIRSKSHEVDAVALAKAELMMEAYDLRWSAAMDDLRVVAVEQVFEIPLRLPSGRMYRGARRAGKIDAIVRRRSDGALLTVEHKNTSADLSQGSLYWQRLRMDSQVSFYFDGAESLGFGEIAGCIYDVLVRPDKRPHQATPPDKRKYTKDGRLYANQRETDETPAEFRARMAESIATAPDNYFARTEVVRLDAELQAARADIHQGAQLIRLQKRTGAAPRNVDACHRMYGSVCSFIDVCSGVASLDDDSRFRHMDDVHPELFSDQ